MLTGYAIAKLCYETLLNYGELAIKSIKGNVISPASEHIVEANTLVSGIGFERCDIAVAHSIHNGFIALPQTHNYYHGEKVAFGTLVSLFLTDKNKTAIDEVYGFCKKVGLPTTLEQLGLKNINGQYIIKVAEKYCAPGEFIKRAISKILQYFIISFLIIEFFYIFSVISILFLFILIKNHK